jgi:hypothetical protein
MIGVDACLISFVAFPLSISLFKQNTGEQVMKESNPSQTGNTGWQPTGLTSKNYVNRTNWVLMMC